MPGTGGRYAAPFTPTLMEPYVKRTLAAVFLACGLATVAVPSAQALPPCGRGIDVNCSTGTGSCRVWVGQLYTCVV